jgi:hypothetical protein
MPPGIVFQFVPESEMLLKFARRLKVDVPGVPRQSLQTPFQLRCNNRARPYFQRLDATLQIDVPTEVPRPTLPPICEYDAGRQPDQITLDRFQEPVSVAFHGIDQPLHSRG